MDTKNRRKGDRRAANDLTPRNTEDVKGGKTAALGSPAAATDLPVVSR
jgi:hypothetical protein